MDVLRVANAVFAVKMSITWVERHQKKEEFRGGSRLSFKRNSSRVNAYGKPQTLNGLLAEMRDFLTVAWLFKGTTASTVIWLWNLTIFLLSL